MERERQPQQPMRAGGGGPASDHNLEATRSQLEGIHGAADRVLNSIQPVVAEQYLQQSRQRGAQ
jgi:hypothetical protein